MIKYCTINYFRRHITKSTSELQELFWDAGKTKIYDHYLVTAIVIQEMLGFKITVDKSAIMKSTQAIDDLSECSNEVIGK